MYLSTTSASHDREPPFYDLDDHFVAWVALLYKPRVLYRSRFAPIQCDRSGFSATPRVGQGGARQECTYVGLDGDHGIATYELEHLPRAACIAKIHPVSMLLHSAMGNMQSLYKICITWLHGFV